MKRQLKKKLALKKETIAELGRDELGNVNGGEIPTTAVYNTCPATETCDCYSAPPKLIANTCILCNWSAKCPTLP